MSASVLKAEAILKALVSLTDAFNAHDLDRIMNHFAEDAVLEMPRGRYPWGYPVRREDRCARGIGGTLQGHAGRSLRRAKHYAAGDTGKWTVTGTSPAGQKIRANGCDFYTFVVDWS
jgi:ketosteroid isomerase-like protein